MIKKIATLKFPLELMHGVEKCSYAKDGLISFHTFGGVHDDHFQTVLANAKRIFRHSLYHEWRLYVATTLFEMTLRRRARVSGSSFCYVEFGSGEGHTLYFVYNYSMMAKAQNEGLLNNSQFIVYDSFCGRNPNEVTLIKTHPVKTTAYFDSDKLVFKSRFDYISRLELREGFVPESLSVYPRPATIDFLHIDMNSSIADAAALRYCIDALMPGATVLIDDYAFVQFEETFHAINDVCYSLDLPRPITLPTGQGLLIL